MGDTDADNSSLSQPVINYPGIKGTEIAFETIRTKQKKLLPGKTQKGTIKNLVLIQYFFTLCSKKLSAQITTSSCLKRT